MSNDVEGMRFRYDDGGRAAAGFKGDANDCVTRAVAIATGKPYGLAYDELSALGARERTRMWQGKPRRKSSARTGIAKPLTRRYMKSLGWTWQPTMHIGAGTRVHLRRGELPMGRLVVQVSRHLCAVVDGEIRDTEDPSRGGARAVYGYWSRASAGAGDEAAAA